MTLSQLDEINSSFTQRGLNGDWAQRRGSCRKHPYPRGSCWDNPSSITGMDFILISSLSALAPFGCMQDTFSPLCTRVSIYNVNTNVFKVVN